MSHASWDPTSFPLKVDFPREYNASVDLLDRHVLEGRGARVAVMDDDGSWTYEALLERVTRFAALLDSLGIQGEQRIALALLDTVDFPTAFLGALRAGVIPVPLNTLLAPTDFTFLLQDSRAVALFVSDTLYPKLELAIRESPWIRQVIVVSSSKSRTALASVPESIPKLESLLEGVVPRRPPASTTRDDVAFWLYSSGSTGAPKGTMHLHSSLMTTAILYAHQVLRIEPSDAVFSAAKLFFAYGLGNALTFPFSVGATAILSAERPTPAHVMKIFRERRPTIFGGVPTLFASMLADDGCCASLGSPALRVCTSAGEALPRSIGDRWEERFHVPILDGIGSTEMLHIFLSNRPGAVRYGTTGTAVPGYELKLVGDDGALVGDGEEGALWVKGASAAIGYWNNREQSLRTFHGPWTRTGDRYLRDAQGSYVFCGRADDMMKVGGIWVSPFEVESALMTHPAVLEAAVVAHADSDGLVKPKAFVVLKPQAAQEGLVDLLKTHVKTMLAPYKYPRWIELVSELPKTATGKIQRFRLRA